IAAFMLIAMRLDPARDLPTIVDHFIRATGACAFVMLTTILCIGPLARIDRRFLPLLFNRPHFCVLSVLMAGVHAWLGVQWFLVQGWWPDFAKEFTIWSKYAKFIGFPFKSIGLAALLILLVMAATSHDFWLSFLRPKAWKALHMLLYV